MLPQMAVLAMHRNNHLRVHQLMCLGNVRAIGMTRDMIKAVVVIDDINTHFGKLVHDRDHATLVARNSL